MFRAASNCPLLENVWLSMSAINIEGSPLRVVVLGSTGSIGTQTLDIARSFPDRIRIVGLAARSNATLLAMQAQEFKPSFVALANEQAASSLRGQVDCRVLSGAEGVCEIAALDDVDVVVTGMVGAAGLLPTLAAVERGRRIALANKETMVIAGDLIKGLCETHGAEIIPVDSEHSAIFQCLFGEPSSSIEKIILTASGGPFRNRPLDTFAAISLTEALNHPNWDMGPKITIDSASMMNKGLEVIEARWLFDVAPEKIDVVIHPQSVIHSMVQFVDGSSKAQLGPPDMKVPIQVALSYPDRWSAHHPRIDWTVNQTLTFEAPDPKRYPCLNLAYRVLEEGGGASAVLNAANEEIVAGFLKGSVSFVDIPHLLEKTLDLVPAASAMSLESRLEADREARMVAKELAGAGGN